ncbi:hypothetical protein F442_07686 [Phytophthora nicotianae P10297]|uniref:Retrotransposon gag domain-containing protein n=1 Tax=Phytophthora nicotianae P10297 TaxID=1317064 RepID=W2ZF76_PHYNI|nr:hypothetical protein F442_07686 [Phytophthora nicotianae P10297]
MSEQVTFEKVKSNGSVVKKQVPVFRNGDWKEWLKWLLPLSENFVFMGYTHSDEDQLDFVEDVQVLLQDDDLLMFNEIVAEERLTSTNVALQAFRRLTAVHCPPGTRALIMDELVQAKKTRTMTVREYARNFRKLLRMIPFVEENDPVPEDLTRMFKTGMPIDWQLELNRHARTWDLASMEAKFEAIECNERKVVRSGRSMQRRQGEQQGKPKKTSERHHQGSQQPDRSGKKTARSKPKQCTYSNKKGHLDTECFRNPNSPSYKPRGDHAGHQSRNAFAVMQEQVTQMAAMMDAIKKRQDEEFSAMRFYRAEEMSVFAVESTRLPSSRAEVDTQAPLQARRPVPATTVRSEPVMKTEVLIGAHRFRALIDTDCSSSAIEETVVNKTKSCWC